ncbi:MAG: hypothetical protein ACLR43_14055 [Faecalibacillus faecis]|jgi:hypothetical protein
MKEKQPYEKPKMTFVENQPERRKSLKKKKLYQYVLQTGSMNVCKMKQENMAMEQIYRDTLGVRYL